MPRGTPFVAHWWAQRWLDVLDELGPEWQSRLARARTYARDGSVRRVGIEPGHITAEIRGSYWENYRTQLHVATFSEATWGRIFDALSGEAVYVAKLLARELPEEVEEICAQAGASLFPAALDEVRGHCTCLDPMRPCKHILALHFVLATHLDATPAQLFLLRGTSSDDVAMALRARWSDEVAGVGATEAAAPDDTSAALRVEGFFQAGPALDAFAASFRVADAPPPLDAALVLRLGRPPFAGPDEHPQQLLAPVYAALTERALQARKRSARTLDHAPGGQVILLPPASDGRHPGTEVPGHGDGD